MEMKLQLQGTRWRTGQLRIDVMDVKEVDEKIITQNLKTDADLFREVSVSWGRLCELWAIVTH